VCKKLQRRMKGGELISVKEVIAGTNKHSSPGETVTVVQMERSGYVFSKKSRRKVLGA